MARDPYFFVMHSPDGARSQTFFSELFGWTFDGAHIDNAALPGAVITSPDGPAIDVYFSLDDTNDVAATSALVESLDGRAGEVIDSSSGRSATCRTPAGTRFAIGWESPEFEGTSKRPPPLTGGELGLVSFPSYNAASTASFFSTLFDWEFDEPDQTYSADQFRHTTTPSPSVGIHPPADDDQVALYFAVPDIESSTRRVGELGGSPGAVWNVGSGMNAACHDPCGVAFTLWHPARAFE